MTATLSSPRVLPAARGRHSATRTTAPNSIRNRTVPPGPASSNSPFATPAPVCTDSAAATTSRGAGTRLTVCVGRDGDHAAAAAGGELHAARAGGEDRVVLSDPHAVAGLEARAALAHDDLAAGHD